MAYSFRQSSSYSKSGGGYGGGSGGMGQCAIDSGYGQGAGSFGGYGQGAGSFGGFGQGAGGFGGYGHGGAGFGQGQGGAGFGQGYGGDGFGQGGGFGGDFGFGGGAGGFGFASVNEKSTMQNLNGRLAAYLEKVKELEESNERYNQLIKEFLEKQKAGSTTGEGPRDYSKYYASIKDVQDKIVQACHVNSDLILQIDNARLAADDFRMKYESESVLRQTVEADINGLRRVQDELNAANTDLGSQLESLTEELESIKKNMDDGGKGTQQTTTGDVNVEMHAAPGGDMLKSMNDMREGFEALVAKNRKEIEDRFKKLTEGLKNEISEGAKTVSTSKTEVSELKKTLQNLQIELQSLLAQKKSLESTLAETEGRYCMHLAQLQEEILSCEESLAQMKEQIECQTAEYEDLLDTKSKLDAEIATYRSLLEGNAGTGQKGSTTGSGTSRGTGSTSGRR